MSAAFRLNAGDIVKPVFATSALAFDSSWPESWRVSHDHDSVEIWGDRRNPGYTSAYHRRLAGVLAALHRHTPQGGKVLDLAAAQGNFSLAANALGYQVTWNDLRADLESYVRLKSPDAGKLEFVAGDIFSLTGFDAAFDTVMALEIIEHVAHPDEFLRRVATLIKPGGHIILTTPNGGFFRNRLPRFSDCPDPSVFESVQFQPDGDGHIFLLHEDEIRSLAAKAGLRVVEFRTSINPLTAGFLGTRALHRVLPDAVIAAVEAVTRRLPGALSRRLNISSLAVLARDPAA